MTEEVQSRESMLVKLENLDKLLTVAGDVIITSSNLAFTCKAIQDFFEQELPLDQETLDAMKGLVSASGRISATLHELVQDIRTVDLSDLSLRARRVVRDAARKSGKRVRLETEGVETNIDKLVVEDLYDPIAHQLRNAVSHGIEEPLTRTRHNKQEEGVITLRASKSEYEYIIEIEDDGGGLDMDRLHERALAAGLVGPGDAFTEEDALDVICMPGVSTQSAVSEIAGRGVGMHAVREAINLLGGKVFLKTKPGHGSHFSYRIPLVSAVNILDGLVIEAGRYRFAFPITNVLASLSLEADEVISVIGEGRRIRHLDALVPLFVLTDLLDPGNKETPKPKSKPTDGPVYVLVIDHKGDRIALQVSQFFSPQKLVIIPFTDMIQVQGLAGTTILGNKELGFIIDIAGLFRRARHTQRGKKTATIAAQTPGPRTPAPEQRRTTPKETAPPTAESEASLELFAEAESLLAGLGKILFSLEKDPNNKGYLNKAFRLFHSLKGNLIVMRLNKAGETIHMVESILDQARGGHMGVTPELLDVLMDGVSFAEDVLRFSRRGEWDDRVSESIMRAGAAMLPALELESEEPNQDGYPMPAESYYRLSAYRKRGAPLYEARMVFDENTRPGFLSACLVYKRLTEVADILACKPSLNHIEKGVLEGEFALLFQYSGEIQPLDTALGDLCRNHFDAAAYAVTRFD